MKTIGLTGGSGSGKGTVGKLLSSFGCYVVDTDALYHGMTERSSSCSEEIIAHFGESVRNSRGGIDRPSLAKIVFEKDKGSLLILNQIAHKHILNECEKIAKLQKENGCEILVYDAPQLFESGLDKKCDITLCIVADVETRKLRICKRDGISEQKASARINSQYSDDYFKTNCDYCITNDSDIAHLLANVKQILNEIKGIS